MRCGAVGASGHCDIPVSFRTKALRTRQVHNMNKARSLACRAGLLEYAKSAYLTIWHSIWHY